MDIYRIIPITPDNMEMDEDSDFSNGFFFEDKETAEIVMAALDAITPDGATKITWKCDIIPVLSSEQAMSDFAEVFGKYSKPD